jgi:hypothetical protein
MISNFTEEDHEFTNCTRIVNNRYVIVVGIIYMLSLIKVTGTGVLNTRYTKTF